ncbi:MAG: hypothetical protein NC340_01220 [Ruminococcus flavefaciens]|nr:hypothetical protein [Ruminococcus flavefaciens]MCM1228766.1 hypothetical protein [Ruminococcus flavefaciens]
MIDLTKPRDFIRMAENGEEMYFTCFSPYFVPGFSLPLEAYIYDNGRYSRDIFDDTQRGRELKSLFTDVPSIMIVIEDTLYYIPIAENPAPFAEIPDKYRKKADIILDFISEYHEILLLWWNQKLDICDLYDFMKSKAVITVCRDEEESDDRHSAYIRICRKLRRLKKAGDFHGDI